MLLSKRRFDKAWFNKLISLLTRKITNQNEVHYFLYSQCHLFLKSTKFDLNIDRLLFGKIEKNINLWYKNIFGPISKFKGVFSPIHFQYKNVFLQIWSIFIKTWFIMSFKSGWNIENTLSIFFTSFLKMFLPYYYIKQY